MASDDLRSSAAVLRWGMANSHGMHIPGEWAHSRCQGLSKRKSKVECRKTIRYRPSEIRVWRFLMFGLLLFLVARHHALGLYGLANLAHAAAATKQQDG